MQQTYQYPQPFRLECGQTLPGLTISYRTYGTLREDQDNVVWICHALTASADAADWWTGLVGSDCIINPTEHFIVCANILGSCYGSTGPGDPDQSTGIPLLRQFPLITIRDMVQAHILLRKHLGIDRIGLLAGGSMGGYQVLEWALAEPLIIRKLFLIATAAAESAWGIAIHTAQRLAIEADVTFGEHMPDSGAAGLRAARAIGMLTYRNYEQFALQQGDPDQEKLEHFRADSYIRYQGDKLVRRFNAYSYHLLTRAMDTHNIARGRAAAVSDVLSTISQPALVMGISSDILCPTAEQKYMADHLGNAVYKEIHSPYGHDGFLTETEKISLALVPFMASQTSD